MSTAIRMGLIAWAKKIGRWLLQHLAAHGLDLLRGYMNGKIGDFKRRLARAKTDRRKAWLRGRIRRWTAALRWLTEKRMDILGIATHEYDALADELERRGVPEAVAA